MDGQGNRNLEHDAPLEPLTSNGAKVLLKDLKIKKALNKIQRLSQEENAETTLPPFQPVGRLLTLLMKL